MVAVPERDAAFFPGPARRCLARRRCCSQAKAIAVVSACRCIPVHDRPSNCPRPSSCLSCWCACSQTQRALMVEASARNAVRGPRVPRWYLRSPFERHSPTSKASSPGRWRLLPRTGPSPTRLRIAANRAASAPLVPRRQATRRHGGPARTASAARRRVRHGAPGASLGRHALHGHAVDLLVARDPHRPAQAALVKAVAERGTRAVTRIGQHGAEPLAAKPGQ